MEYESVSQKVLLLRESILQNAKQLQRARLSWHVRCRSFLDSIKHLPAKCPVSPLLFAAEHYESLEIALTNIGQNYLKVDLFHIEFCSDDAF
jgi:hypothetical protein